jgi:hypothetical protein
MKNKLKFLAVALIVAGGTLAGGTLFAQPRVSIGIGVGGYARGYYAPPVYAQPPCPGPGYAWIDGYWVPEGGRNVWINGYWRAPYVAPYAVGPRFVGPGYYGGGYYGGFRGYGHGRDYGRGFVRGGERFGHEGGHRR